MFDTAKDWKIGNDWEMEGIGIGKAEEMIGQAGKPKNLKCSSIRRWMENLKSAKEKLTADICFCPLNHLNVGT